MQFEISELSSSIDKAKIDLIAAEKNYEKLKIRGLGGVHFWSQNKWYQRVYLVDRDDFCFWFAKKYLLEEKLRLFDDKMSAIFDPYM